jgi:chorismate mutase / prephenate dehydratase
MPERRRRGPSQGGSGPEAGRTGRPAESAELRRLRRRIDALDRRIVRLLNERAELGREVGRVKRREGRRAVRDLEREREVLLRVAMANVGPLRQADLLAIYRRLVAATRAVETADGAAAEREGATVRARPPAPTSTRDDGGR